MPHKGKQLAYMLLVTKLLFSEGDAFLMLLSLLLVVVAVVAVVVKHGDVSNIVKLKLTWVI